MQAQIECLKQEVDSANAARGRVKEELAGMEDLRNFLEEKTYQLQDELTHCKTGNLTLLETNKKLEARVAELEGELERTHAIRKKKSEEVRNAAQIERDTLKDELASSKKEALALLETTKRWEARVAELENNLETAQSIYKEAVEEAGRNIAPVGHVTFKVSSEEPVSEEHEEECSVQLLRIMEETVVSKTERATKPKAAERATRPKARQTRSEFRCWNCNEKGHFRAECGRPLQRNRTYGEIARAVPEKHQGPRCWNCNIIGHFQRNCRRPIKVKTRTPQGVVRGDYANEEASLRVRGKLGNTYQEFLLDTGSFRSIIRPSLVKGRKRWRAANRFLRTANGNTVPVQGVIKTGFQLGQTHFYHEFLIANVVDDCILGFDFLQNNGLMLDLNKGTVQYKNVQLPLVKTARRANDCKINRITENHDYRNQSKRPQGVCRIPNVSGTWRNQPCLRAETSIGSIRNTPEWCWAKAERAHTRTVNRAFVRKGEEHRRTQDGVPRECSDHGKWDQEHRYPLPIQEPRKWSHCAGQERKAHSLKLDAEHCGCHVPDPSKLWTEGGDWAPLPR